VAFPGGFGTLDELFEILTLQQTRKAPMTPTVLVHEKYWRSIVNFDAFVEYGMIDAADLDLLCFAEDAEEAWSRLAARGIGSCHGAGPR
jgi:predicted Rossmann-fold nucleotide-binding protein